MAVPLDSSEQEVLALRLRSDREPMDCRLGTSIMQMHQ
jgi:hypothetical protein